MHVYEIRNCNGLQGERADAAIGIREGRLRVSFTYCNFSWSLICSLNMNSMSKLVVLRQISLLGRIDFIYKLTRTGKEYYRTLKILHNFTDEVYLLKIYYVPISPYLIGFRWSLQGIMNFTQMMQMIARLEMAPVSFFLQKLINWIKYIEDYLLNVKIKDDPFWTCC